MVSSCLTIETSLGASIPIRPLSSQFICIVVVLPSGSGTSNLSESPDLRVMTRYELSMIYSPCISGWGA